MAKKKKTTQPRPAQEWDVVLKPYKVQPFVTRQGAQIEDWGHKFLKANLFYPKTRGEGCCIFFLDTAGEFIHPDLEANNLKQYNKNFTDSPTDADVFGHGTHCCGIANAADNDIGVIGIAPKSKNVAVKVLNDSGMGSYGWISDAIRYVADIDIPERKIVSLSLGGSLPNAEMRAAIQYGISKGCFVVAAAGNRGYKEGVDTVDYPGKYVEVITIASIGPDSQPSYFSSAGPAVDLAAPGEKVYSTHKNGGYAYLSGTSMATPHVSGLVALILSENPEITTQSQLEQFLKENATDIFDKGEDVRTGAGAPISDKYTDAEPGPGPDPEPEPTPPTPAWLKIGLVVIGLGVVLYFAIKTLFSK